jgi:redox-sensing transcriptional repressor
MPNHIGSQRGVAAEFKRRVALKPLNSYRYFGNGISIKADMKTQSHSRNLRARTPANRSAVPAGDKSAFPETLLRQAAGARKAGLPCVKRMPAYLQLLRVLQADGQEHVSGTVLASVHNLEPVIVRKDLAMTGAVGTPRIGFRITELIAAIERFLGWDNQTTAVLVGVGSLGTALLGYQGFQNFGFRIIGAFDRDPRTIGKWVHGRKVQAIDQLMPFARRGKIQLGVLTVPAQAAQETAALMVRAGIKGIWNFSPSKLQLPAGVVDQKEDLAEGLAVLSHRMHHLSDSGIGTAS